MARGPWPSLPSLLPSQDQPDQTCRHSPWERRHPVHPCFLEAQTKGRNSPKVTVCRWHSRVQTQDRGMSSAPQTVLGAASVTGAGHLLGRGSDTLIQLLLPKSLWGPTHCSGNRRLCCLRPIPALALPPLPCGWDRLPPQLLSPREVFAVTFWPWRGWKVMASGPLPEDMLP